MAPLQLHPLPVVLVAHRVIHTVPHPLPTPLPDHRLPHLADSLYGTLSGVLFWSLVMLPSAGRALTLAPLLLPLLHIYRRVYLSLRHPYLTEHIAALKVVTA